jgi:hypothetical protein
MDEINKKPAAVKVETAENTPKNKKRKVSKTWEAMQKYKGSLIVNDPTFLL